MRYLLTLALAAAMLLSLGAVASAAPGDTWTESHRHADGTLWEYTYTELVDGGVEVSCAVRIDPPQEPYPITGTQWTRTVYEDHALVRYTYEAIDDCGGVTIVDREVLKPAPSRTRR